MVWLGFRDFFARTVRLPRQLLIGLLCAATWGCSTGANAPAVTTLTPESHDAQFPIASGIHGGIDCQVCHGAYDSFARFDCTSCHPQAQADPQHPLDLAPGYAWGPETCYGCHPRGERAPFDHTPRFPIAPGQVHQGFDCSACHPDRSSRLVFTCVTCHADADTRPRHAAVPDYVHASASCYACHPDSTLPAGGVNHAPFFPIGVGTLHAGVGCAQCHLDPADRKVLGCAECHTTAKMDPAHAAIAGYANDSRSCYGCHPQANLPGVDPAAHTAFPIAAGQTHQGLACATCHPVAGDRKQISCTTCHTHAQAATNVVHTGVPGYAYESRACYGCHPTSNVPGIDHVWFPTAAGTSHQAIKCGVCHTVPGDRTVLSCAGTCHPSATMAPKHGPVGGYQYSSPLCARCHADSQVDRVSAHLPFSIQSTTKHYRKSCLECHPQSRTDKPWGADFVRARIACGPGCHGQAAMNDKHSGFAGYTYTPFTTCLLSGCHQNGRKP